MLNLQQVGKPTLGGLGNQRDCDDPLIEIMNSNKNAKDDQSTDIAIQPLTLQTDNYPTELHASMRILHHA